ncbi:MAG: ABC transporter permease [Gammaproteobacteria bacterium]|nr:ABC transporter permease [Gammaproteobacteria bacterium]
MNRLSALRLWAMVRKEFVHIRRDPRSLAMAFLMPLILLALFGYAITMDITNLNLVVVDHDRSSASRNYLERFSASGYFTVVAQSDDDDEARRQLDGGQAHIALIIPRHFARELEAGRAVAVQALIDGADANTAAIGQGYLEGVSGRFNAEQLDLMATPLLENRLRVWYNPELKSRWFIIPGLMAVIMTVITALLTSLTVSREWESGTMEQLISTPVQPLELMLGKMVPYFIIGMFDMLLAVALAVWVFGVPLHGSLLFLVGVTALFLFGGLGLGIFISTLARSQLVASQAAMVSTFIPAFLLSGFLYSIENMPAPLQGITHLVQARYFVAVLKAIFLKASPPAYLLEELAFLALFAAVVMVVAVRKFEKKLR